MLINRLFRTTSALVSQNVVFSTCPGLVVRVEEADAWLTPVPAHTVILASGKQASDIFTSLNISCIHRMKDGIGGRTIYVGTIVEIQYQQSQFHIVLAACYRTYLIFFSCTLLGFDTNEPLNDYLIYTEDSRYTPRVSTNQHQTITHTLTVSIKINTVPNTY